MDFQPDAQPHFWINRLSFVIRKDLQSRFRKRGYSITAEEWAVLLFLWQRDGRSPGELASLSVRDATTMTRMLDAMERKGLIIRKPDAEDRRRSCVCLTQKGLDVRPDLVSQAQDLIEGSLEGVSQEDLSTTLRTLKTMQANLDRKGETR